MALTDLWDQYLGASSAQQNVLKSAQNQAITEKGYRDAVAAALQRMANLDANGQNFANRADAELANKMQIAGKSYSRSKEGLLDQLASQGIINSGIAVDAASKQASDYLDTVNNYQTDYTSQLDNMFTQMTQQKAAEQAAIAQQEQARKDSQAQWSQYMAQMEANSAAQKAASDQYQAMIQSLISQTATQQNQNAVYDGSAANTNQYVGGTSRGGGSAVYAPQAQTSYQETPTQYFDPRTGLSTGTVNTAAQHGGADIQIPTSSIPTNAPVVAANSGVVASTPQTHTQAPASNPNVATMVASGTVRATTPESNSNTASMSAPSAQAPAGVYTNSNGIRAVQGPAASGPTAQTQTQPQPAPAQQQPSTPPLPANGLLGQLGLQYGHIDGQPNGDGSTFNPYIATAWTPEQLAAQRASEQALAQSQIAIPNATYKNNYGGYIPTY